MSGSVGGNAHIDRARLAAVPCASEHPEQIDASLYGANSCLPLDGLVSETVLERWSRGRSALCGGGQSVA